MTQATDDIINLSNALKRGDVSAALAMLGLPGEPAATLDSIAVLAGVSGRAAETPLSGLYRLREEACSKVEQLIALIDVIDGDPDLEHNDVDDEREEVSEDEGAACDDEGHLDSGIGDNDGLLEQVQGMGRGCGASGFAEYVV